MKNLLTQATTTKSALKSDASLNKAGARSIEQNDQEFHAFESYFNSLSAGQQQALSKELGFDNNKALYENLKSLDTTDAKSISIKSSWWSGEYEEITDANASKVTGEDMAVLDETVTAFIERLEEQEAERLEAQAKENIATANNQANQAISDLEKDISSARKRLDTIKSTDRPKIQETAAYNLKTYGPDHDWYKYNIHQLQQLDAEEQKLNDEIHAKQQQIARIKSSIKSGTPYVPTQPASVQERVSKVENRVADVEERVSTSEKSIADLKEEATAAHAPTMLWNKRSYNNNAFSDHIKILQQFLKDEGLYSGDVDGDYGGGTKAAVIAYQQRENASAKAGNGEPMSVDGSVGPETWAHIIQDDANVLSQLECCATVK